MNLFEWCIENDKEYLLKEWDYTKNSNIGPSEVTYGSNKRVWWQCEVGHEWDIDIKHRTTGGTNCPYCSGRKLLASFNDLKTINPDLANEWHPKKNGNRMPEMITAHSGEKVWWLCMNDKKHSWQATVTARKDAGNGCPYCSGRYPIVGETDLQTINPTLAAQWHPTKNESKTPQEFTANSSKKAWWIGNCNHEWEAIIGSRNKGNGCPYCSGKYVISGETDLETVNSTLSREWHPTKNGELTPRHVSANSNQMAWWQCKEKHVWKAQICSRHKTNASCPLCSGREAIEGETDLATINPKLASEWHPTKNGDLTPGKVKNHSGKLVWWLCKRGHESQSSVDSRSRRKGCPICFNETQTSLPEQIIYHYLKQESYFGEVLNRPTILGVEVDVYLPKWNIGIEYDGRYYHQTKEKQAVDRKKDKLLAKNGVTLIRISESTQTEVDALKEIIYVQYDGKYRYMTDTMHELFKLLSNRIDKTLIFEGNIQEELPTIMGEYIESEKENSLLVKRPDIAKEWHPTRNGFLTPDQVTYSSKKLVWWICEKGHEWQINISNRNSGNNCPYCSGRYPIVGETDLITTHPNIAKEWDYEKNEGLTPEMVTAGSEKKVYWKCKKEHSWMAVINSRRKNGCPICSNKIVLAGFNDLATTNPKLTKEWHPTLNYPLSAQQVTLGSSKKVWWQCKEGHEWIATVCNRNSGRGCDACRKIGFEKRV